VSEPQESPHCPFLFGNVNDQQCHARIVFHHFRTFCNTGMYHACPIYGAIKNELKEPIEWLQHIAVNQKEIPVKDDQP
jgi:hypothetical protein